MIDSDPENILERMIDEELLIQRGIDLGMIENDSEIRSIIIQKMISSIISDANDLTISQNDLENFYSLNKDLFTPSPKLHLIKLSFKSNNKDLAIKARDLLIEGDFVKAKSLAENEVITLPNTILPTMKIREYIGPSLTQIALDLEEGEVSELIEFDEQAHILILIKKIISSAPPFSDVSKEVESEYIRYQGERMLDEYLDDLRNWYDVVKANEL